MEQILKNLLFDMIVGNGLIASAFKPYYENTPEVTIFASGVANSKELDTRKFNREFSLIQNIEKNNKLIYFSSVKISEQSTYNICYLEHKEDMEKYIKKMFSNYLIIRLEQIIGFSSNPFTLINFLADKIYNNTPFDIWNGVYRNLLDIDDLTANSIELINTLSNEIIEIKNNNFYSGIEIVKELEQVLNRTAKFNIVFKPVIVQKHVLMNLKTYSVPTPKDYLNKIIKKYYSNYPLINI